MDLSTSPRVDVLNEWTMPRTKLNGNSALQHLFNRLDGMYPGRWGKNFPGPGSVQNWKDEVARVFEEEGITLDLIAVGLRACRRLHPEWPPSVPEFVNACNPPVDPAAAYHEAVAGLEARGKGEHGTWSHPAIYWAASSLQRELASQPGQYMRDRWAAVLGKQLALGAWDEIPAPRLQLAAPGKSLTATEDAARELAKIGAMGIIKKRGSKDWAADIMRRHGERDPELKLFQVKAARAALGLDLNNDNEGAI